MSEKSTGGEATEKQENNKVDVDEIDSDDSIAVESKNTCEVTYYGEASGNLPIGLTYDYKYTYTLKNDGTFTAKLYLLIPLLFC